MNAEIKQLENLTIGEINKLTKQSIDQFLNMKKFIIGVKKTDKSISAQDLINAVDTKIKVNLE
jgi:hypothetical protein